MKTSLIGYPRIGASRELKKAVEQFFQGKAPEAELQQVARELRAAHWRKQQEAGIDHIPSHDFSFYDQMLDMAVLLGAVPARYRQLELSPLQRYFAMARGFQGEAGDVKALPMKKWFNTNYHYLVPEIGDEPLEPNADRLLAEYEEALALGVETRPVLIGPWTFLKLSSLVGSRSREEVAEALVRAYQQLLARLAERGVRHIQLDEPALVLDVTPEERDQLETMYQGLLAARGSVGVLLQTYFGDIRDVYRQVIQWDVEAIGLDFVEGRQSLALVERYGFPAGKRLVAGVVNGRNIWRNRYAETLRLVAQLRRLAAPELELGASCSLLHVPYTVRQETRLPQEQLAYLAFAEEKLAELRDLAMLADLEHPEAALTYQANEQLFAQERVPRCEAVQQAVAALKDSAFTRQPGLAERVDIQREALQLPLFPTTTIGSFPQTAEVRANRMRFRRHQISEEEYRQGYREHIRRCIALQEEIGLDVLVHGEFERNDMVEFFGEKLGGFLLTDHAWVQSYGTRCVKPPIVWGDVQWLGPMTVEDAVFAQSLSAKPVKGMLTGPVTILNWSFPREDISLQECAWQLALAIRQEVLALEAAGIRIIQVDEAALKEKLPLRQKDWQKEYLDWAIPAFRLVHSGVQPQTQIHTHMCYSEFATIIREIDAMDADVITFEASRSNLGILPILKGNAFQMQVGPGVYDIHSPRVPSVQEMSGALRQMLAWVEPEKLWVNPDCGLKTRGEAETEASLRHMVAAARDLRAQQGSAAS